MIDFALKTFMEEQLGLIELNFKRYKYNDIEWDLRLVGLVEPRGIGKSTMVLQRIKETYDSEKVLYVSAEHGYSSARTLIELADTFAKDGGEHLYLEKAQMIGLLRDETGDMRGLGKIEKVNLDNTNVMAALVGEKADVGTVRETFFYNQTRVTTDVIASRESDFLINPLRSEAKARSESRQPTLIKPLLPGMISNMQQMAYCLFGHLD